MHHLKQSLLKNIYFLSQNVLEFVLVEGRRVVFIRHDCVCPVCCVRTRMCVVCGSI